MRRLRALGLGGVALAVVVVWAVAAVLLLTGIARNADSIDDTVATIDERVGRVDQDLEAVRLAKRTARLARRIERQARPLDRQLGRVVAITDSIDGSAFRILLTARGIEAEASSIAGRAAEIEGTVDRLAGTAFAIERTVQSIEARAGAVERDTDSIGSRLAAVLTTARSADPGVRGINLRADAVIAVAAVIERELGQTNDELGPGHRTRDGDLTIHGHAHDIDCRLAPEREYCAGTAARQRRSSPHATATSGR